MLEKLWNLVRFTVVNKNKLISQQHQLMDAYFVLGQTSMLQRLNRMGFLNNEKISILPSAIRKDL